MDSLCDHVHEALHEFEVKFEEQTNHYVVALGTKQPIHDVRTFGKEFRLLKYFHDCTLLWHDAVRFMPLMETLGSKIEAVILQVGTHIIKVIPKETNRCSYIIFRHHNLRVAASNAVSVLTKSIEAIEDLKPVIRGLYREFLSSMSKPPTFLFDAPLKVYAHWKKLVKIEPVIENLIYDNTSLKELIQVPISKNLARIVRFIERLINTGPQNSKVQLIMVHIGRIVICAAFVCFEAWLWPKDQTILNQMAIIFKDLQQNTDLSTSKELVDLLLALLQSYSGFSWDSALTQVWRFVREFYDLGYGYITKHAVNKEMASLLMHFITSPDDAQFSWEDVRMLVMKANSYKYISSGNCHSLQAKLLANICLIKKDMFFMRRIRTGEMVSNGLLKNTDCFNQFYYHVVFGGENVFEILGLIRYVDRDVTSELYDLLSKILLARAELFLEELINENDILTELDIDSINSLLEGVKLLGMIVKKQSQNTVNSGIFEGIRTLARELCSLCCLFPDDKIPETMANNVNRQISDLRDKFNVVMADFKRIYLDSTIFTFPATNKIRLVDSLLSDIQHLLILKQDVIIDVTHSIEEVGRNLEFLKSFLSRVDEQGIVAEELNVLTMRAMALAQEMQYFVDKIFLKSTAVWMIKLWIYNLPEDFRLVTRSFTQIYETFDPGLHINSSTILQLKTLDSTSRVDQNVVRLKDQQELIIDRLTLGTSRDAVSIVGMAGIGKTTLAHEVYKNPKIVYHFHLRAWCNVSQKYRKRELVLDLLSHTIEPTDSILQMSDEDLELKLYQSLKQRRYLIVMDDLWDAGAWDELVRSLPNDQNGSRILITSRIHEAVKRVSPTSDPHLMRLLSDDESWDLLQMKVFQEGGCPADLVETGKLIAHNCRGLPLAVVAIAGLMERSGKTQELWIQIAENLRSQILDDPQTRCAYILGLSYKHLPDCLKECFLYFGAFEGGIDIPVRKLICLWIAEGFIPRYGSKSYEDVAEDYLMDLVGRSLVTVADRRSLGGIKACRLHDLLHELCHSIATEDNFMNRVIGNEEHDASFNGLDYGVDPIPNDQFWGVRYEDHRLSILSKRKRFVSSSPFGPHARSLLFFGMSDAYPRCPYDITFITSCFKLLKVLDLESINMGNSFPKDLKLLIHLRYLAVCGDIDLVPSSIDKLVKLQMLIIRGLKGQVVLPYTIWSMSSLRHLHVKSRALFDFRDGKTNEIPQPHSLVTLSLLFLYHEENKLKILSRLPNLKKLSCVFAESPDQSRESISSLSLDSLIELVSLKIIYLGKALTPCQLYFPANLKKLTLSNFRLPWDRISAIGELQNLDVLKLLSRAFEGENWEMVEGEFTKLKFLKLEGLNIVQWNAFEDHLPNLQVLVLQNCKDLVELPSSFIDIPTLQLIEVKQCGSSLEESVRNIDEEGIRVLIHSSNMEPRS